MENKPKSKASFAEIKTEAERIRPCLPQGRSVAKAKLTKLSTKQDFASQTLIDCQEDDTEMALAPACFPAY